MGSGLTTRVLTWDFGVGSPAAQLAMGIASLAGGEEQIAPDIGSSGDVNRLTSGELC